MKRHYRVYKAKKDLMWKGQVVYEKGEEIHDPFISRAKFYTVDAQDDDYLLSTKQCKKLNRLGSIPIKLDDIELIKSGILEEIVEYYDNLDWNSIEKKDLSKNEEIYISDRKARK